MKLKNLINCLFCLLFIPAMVQSQDFQQLVTIHYNGVTLDYALSDISRRYQANFVYSKDKIPVHDRVTVHLIEKPLKTALDELFFTTQIEYKMVGSQIVLSINPNKEIGLLGQVEKEENWNGVLMNGKIITPYTEAENSTSILLHQEEKELPKIVLEEPIIHIHDTDTVTTYLSDDMFLEPEVEPVEESIELPETETLFKIKNKEKTNGRIVKGQISLLPVLGTNLLGSEDVNHISVNIFWGINQNLEGFEIGGLVNTIQHNVKGVQLAGMGNTVGGEVIGSQLAGGINFTKGKMTGLQGAGLGNIALSPSNATQLSGIFNYSQGYVEMQVAGLVNVADEVEHGQIAIVNKATTVHGFQVGLFNVADTVFGTSIGLLSLVENGYNRIEIAGHKNGLQATLGLKLGTHRFYNIFQAGIRTDNFRKNKDGNAALDEVPAWGIGYGLGTNITLSNRLLLNLQTTAMHVNEKNFWTKDLNLLNQLHLTLDARLGNRFSIFAGPTLNVMVSKLYNPETLEFGSSIAGKTFVNQTNTKGTNTKMWLGMSAGIRF